MKKIVRFPQISALAEKLRVSKKTIALCGGCFDVLHVGHVRFLTEAKKHAQVLIVLLESDKAVKKLKGAARPHFSASERAEVLAALSCVDYIVLLPPTMKDDDYRRLVETIRPSVIAITEGDRLTEKKNAQAEKIGGKIVIIPHFKTFSTSQIARLIGVE